MTKTLLWNLVEIVSELSTLSKLFMFGGVQNIKLSGKILGGIGAQNWTWSRFLLCDAVRFKSVWLWLITNQWFVIAKLLHLFCSSWSSRVLNFFNEAAAQRLQVSHISSRLLHGYATPTAKAFRGHTLLRAVQFETIIYEQSCFLHPKMLHSSLLVKTQNRLKNDAWPRFESFKICSEHFKALSVTNPRQKLEFYLRHNSRFYLRWWHSHTICSSFFFIFDKD